MSTEPSRPSPRRDVLVRRTERWFVRQGVPHLIANYGFRTHVLPRMLPFLAATIVASVVLALLGANTRPGVGVVVVAALVVAGLLGLPWLLARLGRQLPRLSRRGAIAVLVAYALTPLLIPCCSSGRTAGPTAPSGSAPRARRPRNWSP